MCPIDGEIAIESDHGATGMDLSHARKPGVREGYRHVGIPHSELDDGRTLGDSAFRALAGDSENRAHVSRAH